MWTASQQKPEKAATETSVGWFLTGVFVSSVLGRILCVSKDWKRTTGFFFSVKKEKTFGKFSLLHECFQKRFWTITKMTQIIYCKQARVPGFAETVAYSSNCDFTVNLRVITWSQACSCVASDGETLGLLMSHSMTG